MQCWMRARWIAKEVLLNFVSSNTEIFDDGNRTRNPWVINSSKAIAGKELSLSCWCIASLYIHHFSTVVDFSSKKYSGSTGHRNLWYQHRNLQWGCRWWDSDSEPLGYKPSALAIVLNSSKAIAGKELSLSSWCIASLYTYHFSTMADFSSEKYSGSIGHRNPWYQQKNLQWGCRWWDSNWHLPCTMSLMLDSLVPYKC